MRYNNSNVNYTHYPMNNNINRLFSYLVFSFFQIMHSIYKLITLFELSPTIYANHFFFNKMKAKSN